MREQRYQCEVIEEGKRCVRGFILTDPEDIKEYGTSRHICQEHFKKGYIWLSGVLGDTDVTVGEILNDPMGARNADLKVRGTPTEAQLVAAQRGRQALLGYGVVREYDDDTLLLRLDEAKDPQAPTLEAKAKKVVGFAQLPTIEE